MRESKSLEYRRLILAGRNQNFEEIVSENQNLIFNQLEAEFVRTMSIEKLSKDILKTLELKYMKMRLL